MTVEVGAGLGALVVTALLLVLPRPGGRSASRLDRLTDGPAAEILPGPPGRSGTSIRSGAVVVLTALGSILGLGVIAGPRPAVFAAVLAVITGTLALLVSRHRARRGRRDRRTEVAQACTVLAAQVRIGQVPVEALRSAAEDCPVLKPAASTAGLGGDVPDCWLRQAAEPGAAGLADLARAWRLSAATGAELAGVLEQVGETLLGDQALNLVIASEAAAPRATGKVMAVLPLVGIGLGYLMGGDPVGWLVSSPIGWACLLIGAVSACAGVLWMERIADHASADSG